jgi:hypothetical protein
MVKLYLWLINQAPYHRRSEGITPRTLNIHTWCRYLVRFCPRPLYSLGKSHQYPSDRTLVALQRWSGCYREDKNLLPLLWIKPWFLRCLSCSLTLYQVSYQDYQFQACSETKYVQLWCIFTQKDFAVHNIHILQVLTSPMKMRRTSTGIAWH